MGQSRIFAFSSLHTSVFTNETLEFLRDLISLLFSFSGSAVRIVLVLKTVGTKAPLNQDTKSMLFLADISSERVAQQEHYTIVLELLHSQKTFRVHLLFSANSSKRFLFRFQTPEFSDTSLFTFNVMHTFGFVVSQKRQDSITSNSLRLDR